ncbi:MAG TPA: CRISPR-associated endonuclease Cas2 [Balneolales bacterium]|nr:CRISPR-associated endonuclease Cas2 [Balneolales bacterium]
MCPLKFGGEEDMFVVVVYDVEKKRCSKVMKYMRKWLEHRQRSVFSGFLTNNQLHIMQHGLRNLIDPEYDNIIIFKSNRANQIEEWQTGKALEVQRTARVSETKKRKKSREKSKNRPFKFRF